MTTLTWRDLLDLDWAVERLLLDAAVDDEPMAAPERGPADAA